MAMRVNKHKLKFHVSDERMGDYLQTVTPWGDIETGYYARASVILSGFALADAEVIT
jgi:hypothetical protein